MKTKCDYCNYDNGHPLIVIDRMPMCGECRREYLRFRSEALAPEPTCGQVNPTPADHHL